MPWRRLLVPTLVALPVLLLLLALGTWQVQRLSWKRDLLAAVDERLAAAPQDLAAVLAAEEAGDDIEFRKLSVYDVGSLGERFDVVLFMGVLYHLRHPLLALDLIHEHAARDLLVFQSMQRGAAEAEPVREDYDFWEMDQFDRPAWPKLHFVERRYAGDETNWWVPNAACAEAMLRSAGFEILSRPEAEVYVCRRAEAPHGPGAVYPAKGPRA